MNLLNNLGNFYFDSAKSHILKVVVLAAGSLLDLNRPSFFAFSPVSNLVFEIFHGRIGSRRQLPAGAFGPN